MWGDNQMNQIILNHKIKTIQKPYQIIVEEENKKVDIQYLSQGRQTALLLLTNN